MNGSMLAAFFFPQRVACHLCGALLSRTEGVLCDDCAEKLNGQRVYQPLVLPDACIAEQKAAYFYHSIAGNLVRQLKFDWNRASAEPLADGMAAAFAESDELKRCELCVPVPGHKNRTRTRGYCQATVLCDAFSRRTGLPVCSVMKRLHHKHSQIGMNREQRRRNIAGAFIVTDVEPIVNKRVLLIDDVFTTGATAVECAWTLLERGAKSVCVLTACRA